MQKISSSFKFLSVYIAIVTIFFSVLFWFYAKKIHQDTMTLTEKKVTELIHNEINPVLDKVETNIKLLESDLEGYKTKFNTAYDMVTEELKKAKERNRFTEMADKAIVFGEREAFEKLNKIVDSTRNPELFSAAGAELLRVKSFYANLACVEGGFISYIGADGVEVFEDKIPTSVLIENVKNPDNHWRTRLKAVELLKDRKEDGVADALLEVMQKDQNLNVVKTAMDTFESLTGFSSPDVFGYDFAKKWWAEHKKEVDEKFEKAVLASELGKPSLY